MFDNHSPAALVAAGLYVRDAIRLTGLDNGLRWNVSNRPDRTTSIRVNLLQHTVFDIIESKQRQAVRVYVASDALDQSFRSDSRIQKIVPNEGKLASAVGDHSRIWTASIECFPALWNSDSFRRAAVEYAVQLGLRKERSSYRKYHCESLLAACLVAVDEIG